MRPSTAVGLAIALASEAPSGFRFRISRGGGSSGHTPQPKKGSRRKRRRLHRVRRLRAKHRK